MEFIVSTSKSVSQSWKEFTNLLKEQLFTTQTTFRCFCHMIWLESRMFPSKIDPNVLTLAFIKQKNAANVKIAEIQKTGNSKPRRTNNAKSKTNRKNSDDPLALFAKIRDFSFICLEVTFFFARGFLRALQAENSDLKHDLAFN